MSELIRYGTKRYGIGPYVQKVNFESAAPPTADWTERPDTTLEIWTKRTPTDKNWTPKQI
jgi:hypothetical protein